MNQDIVDVLLHRFDGVTQSAYVNIGGATVSILWMLAGIAVALAVVWNMFGGKTPWMALFSKFMLIGFFSWLVGAWPDVVKQIQGTFIQVGLMAGGSSMSPSDFLLPSKLSELGAAAAGPLFQAAKDVSFSFSWSSGISGPLADFVAFYVAGWFVKFAYWLAALMVLFSQAVFLVSSVVALFMTAFMVFTGTAWMGRGALGWLVSAGTMLMALAAITSIMMPVITGVSLDKVDEYAANQAVLSSLIMISLVLASATIARGIGNGIASWGMGAAMSTAGTAAVAVGAAAAGTAMVAGPAARAAAAQLASMNTAAASGPKITLAGSQTAKRIEDMSLAGRTARAQMQQDMFRAKFADPPKAEASGSAKLSKPAARQLESVENWRKANPTPSAISSIFIARAAAPEVADDGASLQPSNVG